MSRPSMPRHSAAYAADQAADDLADREEDGVEAHDRAAVGREPLGHVGQQAEGRRRRAGEDEQPARPRRTPPTIRTTSGRPLRVVDDERRRP